MTYLDTILQVFLFCFKTRAHSSMFEMSTFNLVVAISALILLYNELNSACGCKTSIFLSETLESIVNSCFQCLYYVYHYVLL